MVEEFRRRLASGERLVGTMVTLTSPSVAEILADVGFDWLFVDSEHGPFEVAEVMSVLQAVGDRVPCIVRVPAAEEVPIKKALDAGAAGIIAPQVNTAELAARVVQYARYAPQGSRGVGLGRAHGYGFKFDSYLASANDQITVIVQAEHRDAVANIESIVKVPGIDAVLIGPYDLSASYGKIGQIDDAEVTSAIERVSNVCQQAGIPLGYFGVTAEAIRPYVDKGYTLIVGSVDALLLGAAARQLLAELQS